jgi:hypothetical protein
MDEDIERLTRNGSVSNEIYITVREAIKHAGAQSGRLYEPGQEPHYMAIAAVMALRAGGYSIEKTKAEA